MKRSGYLRLLLLSVLAAFVLSGISLLFLNRLADEGASRPRGDFLIFLTDAVEQNIQGLSPKQIQERKTLFDFDPRGMGRAGPRFGSPPPGSPAAGATRPNEWRRPPPPFGGRGPGGPPGSNLELWLVTESGELVFQNQPIDPPPLEGPDSSASPSLSSSPSPSPIAAASPAPRTPLPLDWAKFDKPKLVHEMRSQSDFFRLRPSVHVVRLQREPTTFLVVRDRHRPFYGPLFLTQAILSFATLTTALFFSLSLTFYYLRRKSLDARKVLLRLEQGDLKARFDLQRFDEFGSLMLDFNRMAHEIEKLVSRLHASETARSNLLQELGHDLRTPLTSLTTSFETLKAHFTRMTEVDRASLFEMIEAEIGYFTELLDKLMTIASLDEPNYKKSTEQIDVAEVLRQELKVRQSGLASPKLDWRFSTEQTGHPALVIGDPHLILRLFKNAFDNASRYAKSYVAVNVIETQAYVEIQIRDDGPGLSVDDLASFGKRRENRARRPKTGAGEGLNFSLGLGSVIMKSIADLHEGTLVMRNSTSGDGTGGAELLLRFPKISRQISPQK